MVYLVVANIGKTLARDVRITFDNLHAGPLARGQKLESSLNPSREIDESPLFSQPIPMLGPGRRISVLFDQYSSRLEKGLPQRYAVTLKYRGEHRRKYSDPPYPLDLWDLASSVPEKGLPDLVHEVCAALELIEESGSTPTTAEDIVARSRFDGETAQRALRALSGEEPPFFANMPSNLVGEIGTVHGPTGWARRAAGLWPTPEILADRSSRRSTERLTRKQTRRSGARSSS
jgi:hypothetical protein